MKKIINKIDEQAIKLHTKFSFSGFKKGEGMPVMVLAAALGAIILISFYIISRDGLTTWGVSFKKLVQI